MMTQPDTLRGQALITGAGRGIGRAVARRLAVEGHGVICSGRDRAALDATAALISDVGGRASVLELDLRDATAIAELPDRCGRVDTVVANSGIAGPIGPAWEISPDAWEETLRVNLTGGFLVARALLPGMVERGSGSLVFVGSTTAARPLPGRVAYAASKSALIGLVRSLAVDAGPFGVRVNLVSPGPVAGDRLDAVLDRQAAARHASPDQIRSEFVATSPLHRLTASDDVAGVVAFLAGSDALGITGSELTVASGMVMA